MANSGFRHVFQAYSGLSVGTFVGAEAPSTVEYGSKKETGSPGSDTNSLGGQIRGWITGWSGWMAD